MERYYGNSYQGHYYAQRDHYVNVWCEVCGGPYYTQNCPNSSGYSTDYYGNYYRQALPYEGYRTQEELNASWNIIGSETASGKVILETPEQVATMDEVQVTVTEGATQVPPPAAGHSPSMMTSSVMMMKQRQKNPWMTPWVMTQLDSLNALDTLRLFFESNAMQDMESDGECFEEGLIELNGSRDESKDEVTEEEQVPSWEDEFSDELGDLPTTMEEECDPIGDLKLLEDLLYQKPSVGMFEEVQVDEVINEPRMELVSDPSHCTKESKKKRLVDEADDKIPEQPKAPQERARNKGHRASSGVKRQPKQPHITLSTNKVDCLLHYTSHLKFSPGKFKYGWSDPFKIFKTKLRSAIGVCQNDGRPVTLNRPDGGGIKEKPPD
ncbi:hypothetical protein L1987_45567 [Smallanthus sonchifolius]|uniref:Uncharacterized protein n=1 Tax=Smallanthus sonchifolius TaxID=185202 RepID=A0ACB9FXY7_9ASTR|nr:hypothetical protein L1987_45567 [Smallanthus sonchifolius]